MLSLTDFYSRNAWGPSPWDNPNPIREELFSIERLEDHARSLARVQTVATTRRRDARLTARLADNATALLAAYRDIDTAADKGLAITPAAEWLLDNYHLVEARIEEIRSDLPPGYYHQLPKLAAGPFAFYPRVLGVAWAFIAHTDSRFEPEMLGRYMRAYQEVQPLTIGELWAISITIRIVLVENLRRLADRIVQSRAARHAADDLADRLLDKTAPAGESSATRLDSLAPSPIPDAYAVQLVHRLRDQDPRITLALTWLDQRLAAQHGSAEQAVHDELQRQSSSTVTVRNIITSMRAISDTDWTEMFETTSPVDDALRRGSNFADMDFATRNLYRSTIEALARRAPPSELDIARAAMQAAQQEDLSSEPAETAARRQDPGYHLFGAGRGVFERTIGFRPGVGGWSLRFIRSLGLGFYVGACCLVACFFLLPPIWSLAAAGLGRAWLLLLVATGIFPAVDAAVALVNRGIADGFGATKLPALALRDGIKGDVRTLVAVPMLLTAPEVIATQLERLEVHHLSSPPGELHFALLSDWVDSPGEHRADDADLLAMATTGIARLNRHYGAAPGGPRFLLLHRRRTWNETEQEWIGWERKRGKLHELNRLLRGATDTSFVATAEPPPPNIRYVITLDADTRLPPDTVRRLIGKMAHPMNRPRFDARLGRVVEGYAVLQPRVTPSLPVGREGSIFQRIFSSRNGIDPYASAASDVYQDLFGEGSYAGKGIYEVDSYEAALSGRVADSTLLSHDLFEGSFARAGLASDIEVVEAFPSRYDVAAMRGHRWARGDWQLLPWILGLAAPATAKGAAQGAMPAVARGKMLDNLRRTLSAPMLLAAILAGWGLPFRLSLMWTIFLLGCVALPAMIPVLGSLAPRRPRSTAGSHLRAVLGELRVAAELSAMILVFLADQAWLMLDAILRTLFRLAISRRHLLEWVSAAQATAGPRPNLAQFFRRMIGAPLIGAASLCIAVWFGHGNWRIALPFALLWTASPAIALWTSRSPTEAGDAGVGPADAAAMRAVARSTWRFFESFVTADENSLPPDNFQEDPLPVVAHRTSPTNIGLYLLSIVSARDFGWIGTEDATGRLEATLATMARLARFRGHFYNWYDTRDLRPLDPPYVSSVDSGNLVGHLIALANACAGWRAHPPALDHGGTIDALALLRAAATRWQPGKRTRTATPHQLNEAIAALAALLPVPPHHIAGAGRADAANAQDDQDAAETANLARQASAADNLSDIAAALAIESGDEEAEDLVYWAGATRRAVDSQLRDLGRSEHELAARNARLASIEDQARALALATEFGFLMDPDRRLLSIGFQVAEGRLDPSCYDLLASEARLASFVAIAKGDVPARHWFRLGRAITPIAGGAALVSWSGSMFEYLMPSLVMRAPEGSLIEHTNCLIVRRQIQYGGELGVPWGISESAYNARDLDFTYQYSNFGVPGLGLKRGLGTSQVVAPYATVLACMVSPRAGVRNFAALAAAGAQGRYGFYEALDYTKVRLPAGHRVAVVRAYMAHHQGMSIVSVLNTLTNGAMRARFHTEPIVQAAELLLQEPAPREVAIMPVRAAEARRAARVENVATLGERSFNALTAFPATHLLSNGHYAVMLTDSGSGYSRWQGLAITRWRPDTTLDDWGTYIYLRDADSGVSWCASRQPVPAQPASFNVTFKEGRASFDHQVGTLSTRLDVLVSSEDDGEVRRVTLTNQGATAREIDITSYAELVLAPAQADMAHQAFSKLFVQTEYLPALGCLLATRRRRDAREPAIWAAHFAVVDGKAVGDPQIETDRARFLGRGGSARAPAAVTDGSALSGSVGTVLDPVFALRQRVRIVAGASAIVSFWTVVATSRQAVLDISDRHRDVAAFARAATLAWTQAQVELYHIGIDPGEASLFQRLAGHLIYPSPAMRPASASISRGSGSQPGLWPLGISGDLPILLLRIADADDLDIARQLLRAHEYWRLRQLAVDLVILNERASSYVQDLQVALETMLHSRQSRPAEPGGGGVGRVYVLRADLVSDQARLLLVAAARVVLVGQRGRLMDQLDRAAPAALAAPMPTPRGSKGLPPHAAPPLPPLEFFNGLGGFADRGREYVTILGQGQSTPAPWINVVANPEFGFQAAAEGGGCTWAANSQENWLTPWSNDPVSDRSGEAFFIRDTDSGALWSPTAQPIRSEGATYVARHGRGYCRFEHTGQDIASDLLQFVPISDPVKISRLTLRNLSTRTRRLSVTGYVEWVLGPAAAASAPFVRTEMDSATGAMFARNDWGQAFAGRIAFADFGGKQTDWTGDRTEFMGRNGMLASPAALAGGAPLSNNVGAGLDPCGALRTCIVLPPHGVIDLVFLLGQAAGEDAARSLITRYRAADLIKVRADIAAQWKHVLETVQVTTPDRAMDIMLNGWLLYQVLACRMWARAAFYQASGAYGFRDQLQDSMALASVRPDISRDHLMRAAARQFAEGDVQHWWLPRTGQGVRTHISDDRVWLAYVAAHYVQVTADVAVLDDLIPFLEGPRLSAGEHDSFFQPTISDHSATLFEHCALALDHSLAFGSHGLPLMGTGDWNDGMNRVGELGRGESVWLGWLLYTTLLAFAPLAEARGETDRAANWRTHAGSLQESLEAAWDGAWYKRAYFDDGTPLGDAQNDSCRIDSIAQSWAVLSGAAANDRATTAMASVERELIRTNDQLALLFAPPFDLGAQDPGYIKAYPAGIRENGGQYTHAALWSVMAFAKLGDGDEASRLWSLINPINHALTRTALHRYKVEPYVVAADVYAASGHVGRGGWTWYTGAAGWMQRAGIESILGLRLVGKTVLLEPRIPHSWPGFSMTLRFHSATYDIIVENAGNGNIAGSPELNGHKNLTCPFCFDLVDDNKNHQIRLTVGGV